jgi:hypothetical protein
MTKVVQQDAKCVSGVLSRMQVEYKDNMNPFERLEAILRVTMLTYTDDKVKVHFLKILHSFRELNFWRIVPEWLLNYIVTINGRAVKPWRRSENLSVSATLKWFNRKKVVPRLDNC